MLRSAAALALILSPMAAAYLDFRHRRSQKRQPITVPPGARGGGAVMAPTTKRPPLTASTANAAPTPLVSSSLPAPPPPSSPASVVVVVGEVLSREDAVAASTGGGGGGTAADIRDGEFRVASTRHRNKNTTHGAAAATESTQVAPSSSSTATAARVVVVPPLPMPRERDHAPSPVDVPTRSRVNAARLAPETTSTTTAAAATVPSQLPAAPPSSKIQRPVATAGKRATESATVKASQNDVNGSAPKPSSNTPATAPAAITVAARPVKSPQSPANAPPPLTSVAAPLAPTTTDSKAAAESKKRAWATSSGATTGAVAPIRASLNADADATEATDSVASVAVTETVEVQPPASLVRSVTTSAVPVAETAALPPPPPRRPAPAVSVASSNETSPVHVEASASEEPAQAPVVATTSSKSGKVAKRQSARQSEESATTSVPVADSAPVPSSAAATATTDSSRSSSGSSSVSSSSSSSSSLSTASSTNVVANEESKLRLKVAPANVSSNADSSSSDSTASTDRPPTPPLRVNPFDALFSGTAGHDASASQRLLTEAIDKVSAGEAAEAVDAAFRNAVRSDTANAKLVSTYGRYLAFLRDEPNQALDLYNAAITGGLPPAALQVETALVHWLKLENHPLALFMLEEASAQEPKNEMTQALYVFCAWTGAGGSFKDAESLYKDMKKKYADSSLLHIDYASVLILWKKSVANAHRLWKSLYSGPQSDPRTLLNYALYQWVAKADMEEAKRVYAEFAAAVGGEPRPPIEPPKSSVTYLLPPSQPESRPPLVPTEVLFSYLSLPALYRLQPPLYPRQSFDLALPFVTPKDEAFLVQFALFVDRVAAIDQLALDLYHLIIHRDRVRRGAASEVSANGSAALSSSSPTSAAAAAADTASSSASSSSSSSSSSSIGASPAVADAHFYIGLLMETRLKRPDAARAEYRRAIKANSQHADALYRMALLELEKPNSLEKAGAYLRKAVEADKNHVDAHLRLAEWMLSREYMPGTEVVLNRLLKLAPERVEVMVLHADFLSSMNRYDEAKRGYDACLKKHSDKGLVFISYANSLARKARYDEQMDALRRGETPTDDGIMCGHPLVMKDDEFERIQQLFERGLALNPDDYESCLSYAIFLHESGRESDQAEQLFRRAVNGKYASLMLGYFKFALFLFGVRKNFVEAEVYFRKALECPDGQTPDVFLWYGIMLIQKGELASARTALQQSALCQNVNQASRPAAAYPLAFAQFLKKYGSGDEDNALYREFFQQAMTLAAATNTVLRDVRVPVI